MDSNPNKFIIYLGRELDESVFKYYYLGYGPFRLKFNSDFLNKFKKTSKNKTTTKESDFTKFDPEFDLYANDPNYDDVGFIGLEFVRGVGVNLSTQKENLDLKTIIKDLIDLVYQGMNDILHDMSKEIELNFVAEKKSGIIASIFHTCLRMLSLSNEDRQYYSSFKEFDISFCSVFDPENEKVKPDMNDYI